MRRIAVVGSSGSGKSHLAKRLAANLGIPHVELDAIQHGPDWASTPAEVMRAEVDRRCPADGAWVADGNYEAAGGSLARERAELIVWLDLSRTAVMRQLIPRTARRVLTRERLWNGNRESLANLLSRDPERSVIVWSWTHHADYRRHYSDQMDERWVRLSSRTEASRFLERPALRSGGA